MASGGRREGAGRKKLSQNKIPIRKSIYFSDKEQVLLEKIEEQEGKNFSDKVKKLLKNFLF